MSAFVTDNVVNGDLRFPMMTDVTVVSTPNDGSCGIGTYTGDLLASMPDQVTIDWIQVPLRSMNPLPYLDAAIEAGRTDNPTIHVQHEYGIYGPKSLWSWLFFSVLLVMARIRDQRIVITFHSAWNDETIGPPLTGLKRLYVAANNYLLAATANQAIFLSENAAADFQKSVPDLSAETIPHGVKTNTRLMSQANAKGHLGYDPETSLIVEPGYIRWEKGCDIFVDIAVQLEDVDFLLAGGCQGSREYCDCIEAAAPENVDISGLLEDDEFHAVFNAADLVLLPYREVTQSGIFNWCVAYEVPVIGSNTSYFRNLASKWDCVEVLDTNDPVDAAEAVKDLLSDETRQSELQSKMENYRNVASMTSVAERHAEIYTG